VKGKGFSDMKKQDPVGKSVESTGYIKIELFQNDHYAHIIMTPA
jgi:hypothetical protein